MIKHAEIPARGKLDCSSVTASYAEVSTFDDDLRLLFVFNTLNQPVIVSLDGGVTDHFELDEEGFDIDLRAGSMALAKPTVSVKAVSTLPTDGSIRVTGLK